MIRMPVAAGTFYPSRPESLRHLILQCFQHPLGPGEVPEFHSPPKGELFGLIVPHAGYIYSGPIAAHSYYLLGENGFRWALLLGPNHTGLGRDFSLMSRGSWRTPLGEMKIEEEKGSLLKKIPLIEEDATAHIREHSLEVQLPFLQFLNPEAQMVPLCISSPDLEEIKEVGKGIGDLFKDDRGMVIIASTDLSHYHPHPLAVKLDHMALEAITNFDSDLLWERVHNIPISMCGYAPVIALLEACKSASIKECKLLKYGTSGETGGDFSQVVGYAALAFFKS
ncbi:MAG: AmmeMemoRadiSam system protein B [Caldiserica bacterium]|nr:AmmeMemoRadiSam system protein B [Caldisericota bacterium]MDH7562855.1 AmmeMemoRadiSam system protein B [Caldisericota bacterium]